MFVSLKGLYHIFSLDNTLNYLKAHYSLICGAFFGRALRFFQRLHTSKNDQTNSVVTSYYHLTSFILIEAFNLLIGVGKSCKVLNDFLKVLYCSA